MTAKRTFNLEAALADARAGRLRGAALRKAIKLAEEFGKTVGANELRKYLVDPTSFAGDAAPVEVRERVAQGMGALRAMGHRLSRTEQMLKRHGVIGTINRIGINPKASDNFERLRGVNLVHLTAEAIVLDYPHLFDSKAIAIARKRLGQ